MLHIIFITLESVLFQKLLRGKYSNDLNLSFIIPALWAVANKNRSCPLGYQHETEFQEIVYLLILVGTMTYKFIFKETAYIILTY